MAEAHPTTTPKQAQTDEMAVFGDRSAQLDAEADLVLLARVEVPRFAKREAGAAELSKGKRLALAVKFAVESAESSGRSSTVGKRSEPKSDHTSPPPMMVEGEEFMVMDDLEGPMHEVPYDAGNPTLNEVWNPNGGGA
jgi:hypothetical protein